MYGDNRKGNEFVFLVKKKKKDFCGFGEFSEQIFSTELLAFLITEKNNMGKEIVPSVCVLLY